MEGVNYLCREFRIDFLGTLTKQAQD